MKEHKSISIADQIFEQLEHDILIGKYQRGRNPDGAKAMSVFRRIPYADTRGAAPSRAGAYN